jgi:hypothetical protein
MEFGIIIIIALIIFSVSYYLIRGAVKDGVVQALIEYDKLKSEGSKKPED